MNLKSVFTLEEVALEWGCTKHQAKAFLKLLKIRQFRGAYRALKVVGLQPAMRGCISLGCYRVFCSKGKAHRVCPRCRRKFEDRRQQEHDEAQESSVNIPPEETA